MAAIDGLDALVREVQALRFEVEKLKNEAGRSISLGTTFRIQVVGTGATASLQAVRTADNNTTVLNP